MKRPARPEKHTRAGGPPVYVIRAPRQPGYLHHRSPDTWRYVGAGFGLMFALLVCLMLLWIALGGVGRARFVYKAASPTPAADTGASGASVAKASPSPFTAGTITGTLAYPGGGNLPAQKVCAELAPVGPGTSPTPKPVTTCITHQAGAGAAYSLTVPAGTYYVYASLTKAQGDYTPSYRAYYNEYVTCEASGNCAMGLHNRYVPVTVTSGQTTSGADPTDWYALGTGQ